LLSWTHVALAGRPFVLIHRNATRASNTSASGHKQTKRHVLPYLLTIPAMILARTDKVIG
jgi:hypothetical protein